MEENLIEQPSLETESLGAQTSTENQEGSMFGKFKDAKTLLEAYNNLQSEFTRKSQKLAEFQKENTKNAVFEQNDNLDDFLKNTGKENYKKEITEILNQDLEINNLPNKYQVAIKIIEEAERKSAQNLTNQEYLDKYVLTNDNIKEKIISNYLSNLNNISSAPKVMTGNSTNIYFSPNADKPKTLKEAGEIFSKMLK
jgi:hypothetical protein